MWQTKQRFGNLRCQCRTPESVIYPDDLAHYPFADQLAEVCTYTISSVATVRTPMIFGPTPVEELAQIETDDIFEDAE